MPGQNAVGAHSVQSAQGEDRSDYQAVGPWTPVNKFGFAKATEAVSWIDPTFAANWHALRAEGKARGAYHFLHPDLDGAAQAQFFLDYVRGHGGLVPGDMLVVDSELAAGPDGALVPGLPESQMATPSVPIGALAGADVVGDCTLTFLEQASKLLGERVAQHPLLVYTDLSIAASLGDCVKIAELWIAYPSWTAPPSVKPWENWRFWQWEFGGGPGGGDRDAFNGTLPEMTAWLNTFAAQLAAGS
jgi:GH25 family lysozyme M1 (1,4-beta-N-acetylmuramidase)